MGGLAGLVGAAPPIPHPPLTFGAIGPELVLVGAGLLLMLVDALNPRLDHRVPAIIAFFGVLGAAAYAVQLWFWQGATQNLGGMVIVDHFTVFLRLVILATAALSIPLAHHYLERSGEYRGEYYALLVFATSGMTLITAAGDLIMVFLALEILSLSLYLMTGFSIRRLAAAEASMKYFLLGAFSSAFFLFGVAFAYGAAGTTNLSVIGFRLGAAVHHTPDPLNAFGGPRVSPALALVAAGLLGIGFLFKVSAAPFHMWTPDAYQGAPTPVTAFMSAGTKVAAFAAFLRVFTTAFSPLANDWRPMLWVLAAVSMVVGSVLAVAQTDVKRMLAYSSVAHAGFILVGFAAGSPAGVRAAMFYLAAYAVMILGSFGIVMLVSERGERGLSLGDYRGLARRSPFLSVVLTLLLVSLAGLPPTTGFIAKVTVFSAAVSAGYWPLVLIAVLASVVAAFFYLRLIVLMYMEAPSAAEVEGATPIPRAVVGLAGAFTLLFGFFPGIIFNVIGGAGALPVFGFRF